MALELLLTLTGFVKNMPDQYTEPRRSTYRNLSQDGIRRTIGAIGAFSPLFFVCANFFLFGETKIPGSISQYYHTDLRDLYVGIHLTLGILLITYKGYDRRDGLTTSAAGFLSIIVAFLPTTPSGELRTSTGFIHIISLSLFFYIQIFIVLVLFRRTFPFYLYSSETESVHLELAIFKRRRNVIYTTSGTMIFAITSISLISLLAIDRDVLFGVSVDILNYFFESLLYIAFGLAWLVKGGGIWLFNDPLIDKDYKFRTRDRDRLLNKKENFQELAREYDIDLREDNTVQKED
ncbi:MAG: hypothetical protein IH840_15815 [Candidatus Heimdallarchaeota archaeon]|nr:hypothetical protein [Candidatus Heimdallarchaeota archaeon]